MNGRLPAALLGGITALALAGPAATAHADGTAGPAAAGTADQPSPWLAAPPPSAQPAPGGTDRTSAPAAATDPGTALMDTVSTVPRLFAALHG